MCPWLPAPFGGPALAPVVKTAGHYPPAAVVARPMQISFIGYLMETPCLDASKWINDAGGEESR